MTFEHCLHLFKLICENGTFDKLSKIVVYTDWSGYIIPDEENMKRVYFEGLDMLYERLLRSYKNPFLYTETHEQNNVIRHIWT